MNEGRVSAPKKANDFATFTNTRNIATSLLGFHAFCDGQYPKIVSNDFCVARRWGWAITHMRFRDAVAQKERFWPRSFYAPPCAASAADADSSHWASDPKTHCALYDATLQPGDSVSWIGECKDGRGEGPGAASFFNNGKEFESFTGNFSGGVAKDGPVTVRWGDGWRL